MCASEEKPRRGIRDLSVSLIRHHFLAVHLSVCLFASLLLDLQRHLLHPAESHTHTMSCLNSAGYRHSPFTEPTLRSDRHDSLGHLNDKPRFQTLPSTSEVSKLLPTILSRALSLPVPNTTALSGFQSGPQMPGAKETQEPTEAEESFIPGPALTNFHAFGNLPPELRIKIWHMSFLPRVVELHPTWPNHATSVNDDGRQQQQWQSGCSNPAALSVCLEAREIALKHFRIAYPLASPIPGTMFNGNSGLRRRILYISPEYDTVALLGLTDFTMLSTLLDSFCDADLKGNGISSLALSTSGQGNDESVTTNFDPTILKDLEQLVLFTYNELLPPPEWNSRGAGTDEQSLESFREEGNKCELVPCKSNAWYVYKEWMRGKGRHFWDNQSRILQVGKNRIRIQDLEFTNRW